MPLSLKASTPSLIHTHTMNVFPFTYIYECGMYQLKHL